MTIDFKSISTTEGEPPRHPRDIFASLPNRPDEMQYLRGPQDQVVDQWWERRNENDLVIKMNTGGGKTLVGLLIARSSLNENKGPAAYLVPDNFLVSQVMSEAEKLGINATTDSADPDYSRARSILITSFQKLFNGKSVFGVDGSAGREPSALRPETIVIDDAHACLSIAEDTSRLLIPSNWPQYGQLLDLLAHEIEQQSPAGYRSLKDGDPWAFQEVPFWGWIDKQNEILEALQPLAGEDEFMFSWPLIADVLPDCRAVFTGRELEIAPACLNSNALRGFRLAQRRIYLTATLADDGVLVRDFGADPDRVSHPIHPSNAGDIGDRLILIPQQTHPESNESELRDLILKIAETETVVVIVPSKAAASTWTDDQNRILDRNNLEDGIATIHGESSDGVFVLVNRYDGVDIPGAACNILVIDGLPEALNPLGRLDASQLDGSRLPPTAQIQRLEQGMGRTTRSNDDHSVIFLIGRRLTERLSSVRSRQSLSPATRKQLELSEAVEQQLRGSELGSLEDVVQQCLNRDPAWIKVNRENLATLRYPPISVPVEDIALREAFEFSLQNDYSSAVDALQRAINGSDEPVVRGYLKQRMAAYEHHINAVEAQKIQKSARADNPNVLRPIGGVKYERISGPSEIQASALTLFLEEQYQTGNALLIGMEAILSDLNWGELQNHKRFEKAWSLVAFHLGFTAQLPELETGRGPDVLWACDNSNFLVCEAKNMVGSDHSVYKKDAEQLSNSIDWFKEQYSAGCTATPLLIHPSAEFERKAAIPDGCRVVTRAKLALLRRSFQKYASGLAENDSFRDSGRVRDLLRDHDFEFKSLIERYTTEGVRNS